MRIRITGLKIICSSSLRFCLQLTLRNCGRPWSTKKASSPTCSGAQVLPLHVGIVLMLIRIGLTNYDDDPDHDPTLSFTHVGKSFKGGPVYIVSSFSPAVLWIRNAFFRIRILLFSWFRIRILFGSYMIFFLYS